MPRLYRPHIPLAVRCQVAERQLAGVIDLLPIPSKPLSRRLAGLLLCFSRMLGCRVADLRLDHDPPLGAREKRGEGKRTIYFPDANDPAHLVFRPHGPEFDGSHYVKTYVRGEHGQYSDTQLIKRERRRQKKAAAKKPKNKPSKWRSRPMGKKAKQAWPKRPFQKRSKR